MDTDRTCPLCSLSRLHWQERAEIAPFPTGAASKSEKLDGDLPQFLHGIVEPKEYALSTTLISSLLHGTAPDASTPLQASSQWTPIGHALCALEPTPSAGGGQNCPISHTGAASKSEKLDGDLRQFLHGIIEPKEYALSTTLISSLLHGTAPDASTPLQASPLPLSSSSPSRPFVPPLALATSRPWPSFGLGPLLALPPSCLGPLLPLSPSWPCSHPLSPAPLLALSPA